MYLFYDLFNIAGSSSDYRMIGGSARKGMDVVMAKFKVLFQHLPGRTEENHEKP
jgi:hypothetical protein